jgi:hypothetical protein
MNIWMLNIYIHVLKEKIKKLDARTLEGTFVKYDGHSKAY